MNPDSDANVEDHALTSEGISSQLTEEQRQRIQKNKEKAKSIRSTRIASKPYDRPKGSKPKHSTSRDTHVNTSLLSQSSLRDTYGGYLLEDEHADHKRTHQTVNEEAPPLPDEQLVCKECGRRFAVSFLLSKFNLSVCDQCRDQSGKHSLVTKTEAKQRYLLRDSDFGEREGPPLPFLLKRNPHSLSGGDMKLFLLCQVKDRSYEIWGGEVGLEVEHQRKSEMREKKKEKKYAKEIKELRRAVHSSMQRKSSSSHDHVFPPDKEVYDPDSDTWTKTCSECGYEITFEKM